MADDNSGPTPPAGDGPSDAARPPDRRRGALREVWHRGAQLELMGRSMGFAAQGLVTLMPLLIVVAAIDPFQDRGFPEWVADGMGLPSHTAGPVFRLFTTPHQAERAAGVLSLALLAGFGLAFAAQVQLVYEKVWELPPQSWRAVWRQVVWLAALVGYVALETESGSLLRGGVLVSAERVALLGASGLLFFWWGQRFLLGGRVGWRALLPGAVATIVGLGGLRIFSSLVFNPMIADNAEAYGAVGVVLVVECWLIGVGFVFYGGALVGRQLDERLRVARQRARTDD
ncbi:YhjD/YihY/BrkB family envelope integrity protein [Streptacidiphilus jiangxiensis]|uniref:Membrane protein n=1 Tax=Streptacidiphilus jiangxiensis TaxID=235985 RepID=A0A1H7XLF8_STRJI|nr:YhjD/YihY/BrkB family envelope integrity protein [Streptacidiphilus jiangxiensis]SEM34474.1 membrane protein [Streptacidiphilus jiangxiensis]